MTRYTFFNFAILVLCLWAVPSLCFDDKFPLKGLHPFMMECNKKFDMTPEKIMEDVKSGNINDCYMACVFKEAGVMDDKGMFLEDKAKEQIKEFVINKDDIPKIEKAVTICAKVNEEEVKDGDEGCERAKLLRNCFKQLKKEM